jgi:exodeoxyribonuclease VII large subunit
MSPRRPTEPRTGDAYSVSEILELSNGLLSGTFSGIRVSGELGSVRFYGSGHCYLVLKDKGGMINGVIWSSVLRRIKFRPEDGLEVIVRGTLGVYPARGQFQIQIDDLEPLGAGALALAFEQLKEKLRAEGLFAPERKRPIPLLPRVVGLVTSKSGAALQDILRVLGRRHSGIRVGIADTRVQGEGAAAEIVRAIELMNEWGLPDVLIVGRGGGSAEDLWSFNEEPVVRAIAHSKIPVISAVGHEVDFTLADFAADLRAPTPSAAAEQVSAAREELVRRVASGSARLAGALRRRLEQARSRWIGLDRSAPFAGFPAEIADLRRRLDDAGLRLARAPREGALRLRQRCDAAHRALLRWPATLALAERRARVGAARERSAAALIRRLEAAGVRLTTLDGRTAPALLRRVETARARHGALSGRLDALSPLAVLARGYAIAFTDRPGEPPRAIARAHDVAAGEAIRIRLHEGELGARVIRRSGDRPPETRSLFDESED